MQYTVYHSLLRTIALVLSLVLVFISGVIHPVTSQLSLETSRYVASVMSATAGVAPTELNQITAALTLQQAELDARDKAIREREIQIGLESGEEATDVTTFILSALVFVLLVLIVLNYILDFMRNVPPRQNQIPSTLP